VIPPSNTSRPKIRPKSRAALMLAFALCLASTGCKSYWVEATIENKTGQTVRELEVDYPTASFGTNSLTAGTAMHYRFQIRGTGPVKVDYIAADGKPSHNQGLTLVERQHGQLTVRLLPLGKVEFVTNLQPAS
jgi:hypothetical protein